MQDEIHTDIYSIYWNENAGAFVQHIGTGALHASSLLMPLLRSISLTDPRWRFHLSAIERELVSDSLVYRYSVDSAAPEGFSSEEGTVSTCTFWYVEWFSRAGEVSKALLF